MTINKDLNEWVDYRTGKFREIKKIRPEDLHLEYEESTRTAGFVYRILDNKTNGTFVEVGSSDWEKDNNTYVLEKRFGWTGVGIDIEQHFVDAYNKNRISECICADALTFNWDKYLEENNFPKEIDFLQIDVDDAIPNSNLLALLNIPLSRYTFKVICVEHIANVDFRYEKSRDAQRAILSAHGYKLIVSLFTDDWWIYEDLNIPPSDYDELTSAAWYGELKG